MNSKMLNAVTMVSIMMMGIILLNCSGDDGAVGPKGDDGDDGKDGNANVISSDWLQATGFADSISDGSNVKIGHIAAPEVTTDVINEGLVIVYMNYGPGPMQLPYTSNAGGKVSTIAFWMKPGKLIPYRFTHDNSNSINLSSQLQYRYIIIPANAPAADPGQGGRKAAPEALDFSDYYAVCKYYGIPA